MIKKLMKQEDIKNSSDDLREAPLKNSNQKFSLTSLKNLQCEIKRGNHSLPLIKSSSNNKEEIDNTNQMGTNDGNQENYFPSDRNTLRGGLTDKNSQKPSKGSIVIMENYAVDSKSLLKDCTQMRNNQQLEQGNQQLQQGNQQQQQGINNSCQQQQQDNYTSDGSSGYDSNPYSINKMNNNNKIKVKEFSCTDLLEQTMSNKNLVDNIGSSSIDEHDLQQVDTLREYYMENEDQLEQLRRQQTADFYFKNEHDGYDQTQQQQQVYKQNPYLDEQTLLAVEKVGTLSPSKIMDEIRQINRELNLKSDNLDTFYETDLKMQIYMLKLQMKARMEDGLIQQRLELKTILNQYLQFIDKLMKDKKNLSETLSFSQTENMQIRDQLAEVMSKYDETENQLKQIFIAYKEQIETSKQEVELKEKKISQMTDQIVLQEQGVKNIRQKCDKEYQDLLHQNKEILKQINQTNSEYDELHLENKNLSQKIAILEDDLREQKGNCQALASKNTQHEENEKRYHAFSVCLQEQLDNVKQQIDSLIQGDKDENKDSTFLHTLEDDSSLSDQQLKGLIQLTTILSHKIEMVSLQLKDIQLQKKALTCSNKELGSKLKESEEMFQQLFEQQNKQYQSLVNNLQNEFTKSKQVIFNLQEECDANAQQTNSLSQLNAQLQQDNSFLQQQISQLQADSQLEKNNIQEKEQLIQQLEISIQKFKDQIHKNLVMIDDIFNGFKEKENLYHQEIVEKVSEIRYLKDILNKYQDGVQKYYSENEQIQLQQIDLLRNYFVNHEQVKSSKNFIEQLETQVKGSNNLNYSMCEQNNNKRCQTPQMCETVIDQRDSRNLTPIKNQQQSLKDSLQSTQILNPKDSFINKKLNISGDNQSMSIDLRKLRNIERSESPFSIQEVESQRLFKIEQKTLIQSLEFEKTMKQALFQKDESINQLSQVINSLKTLQDSSK